MGRTNKRKNRKNKKRNQGKSKDKTSDTLSKKDSNKSKQKVNGEEDEDNYDIEIFQSAQAMSENVSQFLNLKIINLYEHRLNKFLSEIDTSINKKNSLSDSRPSIDETDEVEPPKPAKAAEPVSKIEEKKLGASNSPVAGQEATNDQKEVKELSVEEYNKSIEDLNDKLFVKVDDPILSNSEDNNENVSDTNLKVDDYEEEKEAFTNEKKFEDFNQSEDFVQETRSEEGKEDQNRLEKESDQSEKCVEEPTNLRNSEKGAKYRQQNKNKHNKNKQNSAMVGCFS